MKHIAFAAMILTLVACTGVETRTEEPPNKFWGNYKGTFEYRFYDEAGDLIESPTGTAEGKVQQNGKYEFDWSISFSDNAFGGHEINGTRIDKNGISNGNYSALNPGISFNSQTAVFTLNGNNLTISAYGKENFGDRRWEVILNLKHK